ncbi:hypothetical protein [Microbacterium sp. SORGH_AS_0888]|uniref:hypothetical protein n=1 Tax=Microbacterium sp. SORGH_AS_0888 TaxID=3041791 RepID=UPI00277FB637|nr:hypothetical protein [Microbacterium sp. SORGH_AS_0888]MDQ1130957.1 hypothetical protein [Microbacterium sp. SORGH_AS_0888]
MSNENQSFDLEKLIEDEKQQKSKENSFLGKRAKKVKKNRLALIIPAGTIAVALVVGLAVYDPFAQNFRGTGEAPVETSDVEHGEPVPYEWWETGDSVFPTEVAEWSTREAPVAPVIGSGDGRFTETDAVSAVRAEAGKTLVGTNTDFAATVLPSREAGFTDDVTKATVEDGSPNFAFSFWTREGFLAEFAVMLNRLTNPRFGGWQAASEDAATDATKATLADLFTSDWLTANGAEALPILTTAKAPVEANYLPTGGTRWVGSIDDGSENVVLTYDPDRGGYVVDFSAQVTYSAWQEDKTVATAKGTLTLKLVPNYAGANSESANRVLITEASLSL